MKYLSLMQQSKQIIAILLYLRYRDVYWQESTDACITKQGTVGYNVIYCDNMSKTIYWDILN